ncbi:hypothetical protein [Mucilaginibacter sp. KACC 22063]|uniref:hypothetical protein n=1 Tax=Mucilaginibacter sp. KACC 22063 TaxID=3025666 RepID=UPI0023658988|nr:hypothetical protein [Mucilaginibacter sp. KACC 22063]WDF54647.1 hypothetical protein PQ461_17075 [Mucilaginibacter sp. KACC 22063]
MKIAYSVFRKSNKETSVKDTIHHNEYQLKLTAHHKTCQRYKHEIEAIQKWLPGWTPSLPTYY